MCHHLFSDDTQDLQSMAGCGLSEDTFFSSFFYNYGSSWETPSNQASKDWEYAPKQTGEKSGSQSEILEQFLFWKNSFGEKSPRSISHSPGLYGEDGIQKVHWPTCATCRKDHAAFKAEIEFRV
ncbi:hypothetical protein MG293_007154 [Ovis ammon polii]|uniref:Uncharacterized protein n=1 Tax=Ovis ammon polii TaxID=230172 RepID=A0AAD4YCP3_OVIAM|nr:hypothetical protein MG293_007154 [Ovis ammon polii]KAI4572483.1 hypothetical protein MJT46_005551 [Ovis ammon polii x Ovis aries]